MGASGHSETGGGPGAAQIVDKVARLGHAHLTLTSLNILASPKVEKAWDLLQKRISKIL